MIACIEDDENVREIEIYTLCSVGYDALGFVDGDSFFEFAKKTVPDLVILDYMLPNISGREILKRIREDNRLKKVPVIMATARSGEMDKVRLLDEGADDYLTKPFSMMEMVSRVRAVLRRVESKPSTLSSGPIVLSHSEHTVYVENTPITLTLKEFCLLELLMENAGQVIQRERLLDEVWGATLAETRTVDAHVKTLRQKLGKAGQLITTVRGLGYRIEP